MPRTPSISHAAAALWNRRVELAFAWGNCPPAAGTSAVHLTDAPGLSGGMVEPDFLRCPAFFAFRDGNNVGLSDTRFAHAGVEFYFFGEQLYADFDWAILYTLIRRFASLKAGTLIEGSFSELIPEAHFLHPGQILLSMRKLSQGILRVPQYRFDGSLLGWFQSHQTDPDRFIFRLHPKLPRLYLDCKGTTVWGAPGWFLQFMDCVPRKRTLQ